MQTPVPVTRPPRPRWQVLLQRTRLRLVIATVARRNLGVFLVLAAAYGVFFDGSKMEGTQSLEEYAALFEKMMKDQNLGGEGEGKGGGSEEDESKKSEFKTEMSKSHITKGKVLLTLKTKGQGERVDVKEKYRTAIRDVKQGVSEVILQEEIPPGYHEGIKSYFDSLQDTPNAK